MRTIFGHENLDLDQRTVATIGTFDGIHVGHQKIIWATIEKAKTNGLPSLLITFDVHPRQVLTPGQAVDALTTLDEKLAFLAGRGLDYACILKFRQIARLSPEDFCRLVLVEKARIAHIFVGQNFRFGAGAAGDPEWLRQFKGKFGVTVCPLETDDEAIVSSTKIRNYLKQGEVDRIPRLLGRNITLSGRVVRGAGRGAGLGFPTANLEFESGLCLPGRGVYVGYLVVNDQKLPSVVNCGTNPTFGDTFHCEAHVLDYHAELYGQPIKLELALRLRDERKFPSPEALTRQITDDVHRAKEWFKVNDDEATSSR